MKLTVEILCLWERYYRRGDYLKISVNLRKAGVICSPKQLVKYIHNAEMPDSIFEVFEAFYIEREK